MFYRTSQTDIDHDVWPRLAVCSWSFCFSFLSSGITDMPPCPLQDVVWMMASRQPSVSRQMSSICLNILCIISLDKHCYSFVMNGFVSMNSLNATFTVALVPMQLQEYKATISKETSQSCKGPKVILSYISDHFYCQQRFHSYGMGVDSPMSKYSLCLWFSPVAVWVYWVPAQLITCFNQKHSL